MAQSDSPVRHMSDCLSARGAGPTYNNSGNRRLGGIVMHEVVIRSRALVVLSAAVVALLAPPPPAATASHTSAAVAWPSSWRGPVGGSTVYVNTKYGAFDLGCPNADRSHQYTYYLDRGRTEHLGIDLAPRPGARVVAIADGKVMNAGALWGGSSRGVVLVQHAARNRDRFTAAYGHLGIGKSPLTGGAWRVGDVVRSGDVIGTLQQAGTGLHLHFGIAPRSTTAVAPTAESNCRHDPRGTVDPVPYLKSRRSASLAGSIVGWRNRNGAITSWLVVKVNNKLRRNWISSTSVYDCLRGRGAIDLGAQPARFLDQLPDARGTHARCP